MKELASALEKSGFKNVKTLLNSGNVIVESTLNDGTVAKKFEEVVEKTFGFGAHTIVRSMDALKKLEQSDPFKGIPITDKTRLYVTFFSAKADSTLKIPYMSPDKSYRILKVTPTEILSMLDLSRGMGTPDAMGILEKEFGKNLTTRNWNTVQKILVK
jgi:uncharacterized protein (DUF1697 family)